MFSRKGFRCPSDRALFPSAFPLFQNTHGNDPENVNLPMVGFETVRQFALRFPETDEHPHFERQAFRVKKKIFATFLEKNQTLNVKLSLIDQSVFIKIDPKVIYPVPGGWGKTGMTTIELMKITLPIVKDALTRAYKNVAHKNPAPRSRK
jgi:hypothetical protein